MTDNRTFTPTIGYEKGCAALERGDIFTGIFNLRLALGHSHETGIEPEVRPLIEAKLVEWTGFDRRVLTRPRNLSALVEAAKQGPPA